MHGQIGWRVPAGDIYSKMILISMIPAREGGLGGLIWPIFCLTPRPQLSNVLRCGVMAKKPKDITPRFGIGEWFSDADL